MQHTTKLLKLSDNRHHCATITFGNITAHPNDDYIIAFYHGAECSDNQRVHIYIYNELVNSTWNLDLEAKTGNPIVWNQDNKVFILFSKFTDNDENGQKVEMPRGPVERWKYCENYLAEITIQKNEIILKDTEKINNAFGLLARCQPIVVNNKTLIPLYREKNPLCEIWEYDNGLKKLSEFGEGNDALMKEYHLTPNYLGDGVAIQPTLVEIENALYAFCRNCCNGPDSRRKAWIATSIDFGKTWNPIKASGIPNHNNSLIAIKNKENLYFVLNYSANRHDIVLYDTKTKNQISLSTPIAGERPSFSYPNYMWHNNNLHIVHTNCNVIAWHQFSKDFLNESFKTKA